MQQDVTTTAAHPQSTVRLDTTEEMHPHFMQELEAIQVVVALLVLMD